MHPEVLGHACCGFVNESILGLALRLHSQREGILDCLSKAKQHTIVMIGAILLMLHAGVHREGG